MFLCLLNIQIHHSLKAASIDTLSWWLVHSTIEQIFQVFRGRKYRFEEHFEQASKTCTAIGLQQTLIHRKRDQCSPPHKSGSAELKISLWLLLVCLEKLFMPGLGYYLQQHRGSTAMVELGCVEMASCTMPSLMPAPYFLTRQKTSPVVDHRYQHSPLFLLHLLPCRPCPFISVQHCFYKAVFLEGFQSAMLSKSKNVVTQIFLRGFLLQ